MFGQMKQLMEMKKQADKIKRELENITAECEDTRGIKIIIDGAQNFKSVEIDPSFLNESNKEGLEKDLLRSMNAAIKKSQGMAAKKMASVMPGMPGM